MKTQFLFVLLLILISTSFSYVSAQESNVIQLIPTDDAYVAIDTANPNNPVTELNTGDFDFLKIFYSFNATDTGQNLVSIGYLKFDLSQLNPDDITSATLNTNIIGNTITDNTVTVFKADSQTWDESSLTFKTKPNFDPTPIDIVDSFPSTNWIQWDVTNAMKQHNGTDITFVIGIDNLKQNFVEEIYFHSKESIIPNSSPFLEVEIGSIPEILESSDSQVTLQDDTSDYIIKELPVIEDAYVVNNYNDPQDIEGLRKINTGNLNFTKIWYSNNATGNNELITTTGFLKFDLSELNLENVVEAKLKMYDFIVSTSGADRIISISRVDNSTWSESELNFDNKPVFIEEIAFAEIENVNDWISWDITDTIKENGDSEITLSVSYSLFIMDHEEQTVFNSKEASQNNPYLEIVYDEPKGGGCLIATATYGTELAPQVQQLRELRDNQLLQTESGTAFMEFFNQFYYSFSPGIADLERQNPAFKEIVKLAITPMITSLSLLNYVDIDSEAEILGYGIGIILLNIGMYFVAPVIVIMRLKK